MYRVVKLKENTSYLIYVKSYSIVLVTPIGLSFGRIVFEDCQFVHIEVNIFSSGGLVSDPSVCCSQRKRVLGDLVFESLKKTQLRWFLLVLLKKLVNCKE